MKEQLAAGRSEGQIAELVENNEVHAGEIFGEPPLPTGAEIKMKVLTLLFKDESGVTAIEYSLIAALIAVAAIGSFTLIGTDISSTFSTVANKL